MKCLKYEIFNICKKYCKVNELEISDSELSALVLYSMFQKGYLKDAYNFVRLYKNEYNENVLSYDNLKGISSAVNSSVSGCTIRFDRKDSYFSTEKQSKEDILLNKKEVEYLEKFIDIMDKNKSLDGFIKDVNELNNESVDNKYNYQLLNNIINMDLYGEELNLSNILDLFIEPVFTEKELLEFNLLFKTDFNLFIGYKENNRLSFSSNKLSKLTGNVNYQNILRELSNGEKKTKSELIEYCISEKFINSDIESIRKNKVIYDRSILKMIDNGNLENLSYYVNEDRFSKIKSYSKIILQSFLINEKDYDLLSKYKNEISIIEKNIYKKYPLLKESYNSLKSIPSDICISSPQNIKEILADTIFLDFNYKEEKNFSIINGLSSISYMEDFNKFRDSDYKMSLNNGLEVTAIFDIIKSKDLCKYSRGGSFENIDVLNIFNLSFLRRKDHNVEYIKNAFQEIINKTDKNTIIAFEFTDANPYNVYEVKLFNKLMKDILKENSGRLFCSKARSSEEFPHELKELKIYTASKLDSSKLSYAETLKIFNHLDSLKKEDVVSLFKEYKDNINEYDNKLKNLINKKPSNNLKV